jgi:tetratricopeptide (TPR) repeat protein
VKALLVGSIARFDRRYSITLEAINSLTGETIAGALAEADGKDQVLQSLGKATTQLRERLGESLASIQKFDAPIEQATTSSLEAFKAWSRGVELTRSGKSAEALPYYKRARDLDQNFAKVYVSFSMYYINQGQLDLAAEYAARAFELKERVSEREKFDIISNYHSLYTGDLAQAIETVEMWRQTYPRDFGPNSRLASLYRLVGQPEKALAAAREANRLNPRAYVPYVNHGTALVQLNRFDEARGVIDDAIKQQLATTTSRRDLFQIGYLKGDAQLMKQQIEWMAGRSDEYWAFYWQANAASYAGQFRQADALYRRAASLVESRNPDRAARFISGAALRNAVCGQCLQSKTADRGPKASSRINLQAYVPANINKSLALAMCGDVGQAQSLIEEVAANNPHSTLANFIWLPTVRAAIEIRRGNYEPAIQLLQATISYESASDFWPLYLRGQAYLRLNKAGEAAEQFKRILDHRGWDVLSPLYPLAHLGLARASALAGDPGASRKSYQDFLAIWKDADPDIPILQAAKKEYEKLK